jgi:hypothetical protein
MIIPVGKEKWAYFKVLSTVHVILSLTGKHGVFVVDVTENISRLSFFNRYYMIVVDACHAIATHRASCLFQRNCYCY